MSGPILHLRVIESTSVPGTLSIRTMDGGMETRFKASLSTAGFKPGDEVALVPATLPADVTTLLYRAMAALEVLTAEGVEHPIIGALHDEIALFDCDRDEWRAQHTEGA